MFEYSTLVVLLIAYLALSVGTTYFLCKAFLWLLPTGNEDEEDEA